MNRPQRTPLPDPTIEMTKGWHCLHIYYRVNQLRLNEISATDRAAGCEQLAAILDPEGEHATARLQASAVTGHRADLAVVALDPNPMKIDAITQAIRSCAIGTALEPTYSFVSITEISEYVLSVDDYAARLQREGMSPDDPTYTGRVAAYEKRLPIMNQQRLYPDIPPHPICCFYPMNKIRDPHANWFMEPFSSRSEMMSEHAASGIAFAGKISQVITASTGFDDWEWGVTLWGRAPEYIKDIVYSMRFDKASAKFAEFGPFYVSYIMPVPDIVKHLKLA